MDPLTHALLGGTLGYAVFAKPLGRKAAAVGALAAFVPDADVFIRSSSDPLLAVEYHRHFTHSLFFAPVGAAIVAALWLFQRTSRTQAWHLWLCALVAYLSHCLLDSATSYGTQLLWPFTRQRYGWDFISIIDLLFTVPLAAGLFFAVRRRRVRPAILALVVAGVYLACGVAQHTRALDAQKQLAAARGHTPLRAEAMPTIANNLVWRTLYLHDGRIYSDRIRAGWFSGVTARAGWALPVVGAGDLTAAEAARDRHRSFERFNWFSEGWVARSPADSSVLGDMRYSLSGEAFDPIWGIRFTAPSAPVDVDWVDRSRDRKIDPGEIWREIVGRDPRFTPVRPAP